MENEFDVPSIQNIGRRIGEIFYGDPDQVDWYNQIVDSYNQTGKFPSDTIQYLIDCFGQYSDEESIDLKEKISQISQNPDNKIILLKAIFIYEEENAEEETNTPEDETASPKISLDIDFDDDEEINNADPTPEEYYENMIRNFMKPLHISRDFARVILSYYYFNTTKAQSEWLRNRKEVLKKLRIELGGSLVPDTNSDLRLVKVDSGECPICYSNENIYQLYCGHQMCRDCLIADIEQQIMNNGIPRCRISVDENGESDICGAEIMGRDVKSLLSPEKFERYLQNYLRDEIVRDNDVIACPNPHCNWIITRENRLPCHVGRCPKCYATVCLVCGESSHAPLLNCVQKEDFCVRTAKAMKQLSDDQEAWLAREERLKEYRKAHVDEVQKVLNSVLEEFVRKQKKEADEEQKRIDVIRKKCEELQKEMVKLQIERRSMIEQKLPTEKVSSINFSMDELSKEYQTLETRMQYFKKDKERNDEERKKSLDVAKEEDEYFLRALSEKYQFFMSKFKDIQRQRALNMTTTIDDDDFINQSTRVCPKCKTRIEREIGCNYMVCSICKYEFCWACMEPWRPKHKDTYDGHFECPNYKIANIESNGKSGCGIDFSDMKNKKFYPQPMSIDKRENYVRFQSLFKKFKERKEKNKQLFAKLMDTTDRKVEKSKQKSLLDLAPLNRLTEILKQDTTPEDARYNALKILNTVYFADSIVLWSNPTLFYMGKKPSAAMLFEYRISELEKKKAALEQLIFLAVKSLGTSDFMDKVNMIFEDIKIILDESETFEY